MSNPYSRSRWTKLRYKAAASFAEHAANSVPDSGAVILATEPCDTCGGTGMVGGFVNTESGYQDDPCSDCGGSGVARPQEE